MTNPNGLANGHSNGNGNGNTNGTNTSTDINTLRKTYEEAGQGHVFAFWDKLSPSQQDTFARQLSLIDVNRVNRIYKNAVAAEEPVTPQEGEEPPNDTLSAPNLVGTDRSRSPSPRPAELAPLPESAVACALNHPDEAKWREIGLKAVADNQVAVLLMAGGQGTRLGSSSPKGMYDIHLPSSRTLFEYQAARIKRLEAVAAAHAGKAPEEVSIRWYVMTSGPTRPETEKYFQSKAYFGLRPENVIFFEQGTLPALSDDGKLLLSTPGSVAEAPDGNGGVYSALRKPLAPNTTTSVLSDLHDRNIKYVHAYCVDNCLVKVADPTFIGYCIDRNVPCGTKVVRKHIPTESVGVLAQRGDGYAIIEYSELSREKAEARAADGRLSFWAANIVNHFYTTDFLDTVEAMERKMAFHIARKKIPCVQEDGELFKPSEPNGMKLEMFVFDIFPYCSDIAVLEVAREEEFSGLKNASGAKADTPETSRRDLLAQQERWLKSAGATISEGVEVEVFPTLSYGGEGLEMVAGKTFVKSGVLEHPADVAALV